jgi:hypothetical protein
VLARPVENVNGLPQWVTAKTPAHAHGLRCRHWQDVSTLGAPKRSIIKTSVHIHPVLLQLCPLPAAPTPRSLAAPHSTQPLTLSSLLCTAAALRKPCQVTRTQPLTQPCSSARLRPASLALIACRWRDEAAAARHQALKHCLAALLAATACEQQLPKAL